MNVKDDHLYHGAALIQIAEDPQFTAINSLRLRNNVVRSAYKVNDEIAVYFKYASAPKGVYKEYHFGFSKSNLNDLQAIAQQNPKTFLGLVCVKDREVCCISYAELKRLVDARTQKNGAPEQQYDVIVTAEKGKKLRVYMNAPGKKRTILTTPLKVSRSAFPELIFA